MIRHVESGFLGHQNDAQQFSLMSYRIKREDCFILGDKIYPNRYPIITLYSHHQIRNMDIQIQRKRRKFSRFVSYINPLLKEQFVN
jgi:hypothetical protein